MTTSRYLVRRHRSGEAAPSLSLSYRAESAREALSEHFRRYRSGVADGERYRVSHPFSQPVWFDTDEARRIAREA